MIRRFLFLCVLLFTLFVVVSPVLAAKSYRAERFDAQIDIQENGAAIVTETVEFHFEGDPFTFAFREVAADNTDGVTFLDASLDGAPMSQGTQPGQVEVEAGDPLKVTWHFPPTANAARTFVVRYRVDGLVRKGDDDSIIWRVVPEDHDYAIKRSTTTLTFPPKAVLLGEATLSRPFTSILTDGPIKLIATDLAKDDDLVLTAHFAPNSLTKVMPKWQERNQRMDAAALRAMPIALVVGLVALLLGSLGLWRFASTHRQEPAESPVISSTNPPTDLPPALVGKLTGKAHGFMGAIFNLAERGVLEVREDKGFWGKKHLLIRKSSNVSLSFYESSLLAALFKPGEDTVQMSEIAQRISSKNTLLDETLEQELVQRGWRDLRRRSQRTGMRALGLVMLFGSFALFVFSILGVSITSDYLNFAPLVGLPFGIGLAMFPLSIALLIYAARFSTFTPSGEAQAARWKDFERYLKDVSQSREPAVHPDYFERYLAYAAAFGLGADWARHFQTLQGVPLPIWFRAAEGSSPTFSAFVAVMHTSDSAGASGGAGGVSGASGGGSSGAG